MALLTRRKWGHGGLTMFIGDIGIYGAVSHFPCSFRIQWISMSSDFKASGELRIRQKLGKYRIERRLGAGGFAIVYQAMDTVQGIRVAIKVPHARYTTETVLAEFRKEIRATSALEHENILPIKDASIIEDRLVVAFPLGEETLLQRMRRRLSLETAFDLAEQILKATAEAHKHHVIHCDIKPENVILFSGNRIRLADFGIAKVSQKTVKGGGTGTVGYMAPEQAMGKPSFRSDVFSIGLILWRLLSGEWPEWPFEWPAKGYPKLRGRIHPDFIDLMRRAIEVNPRHRYRDAQQMLAVFLSLKYRTLRHAKSRRRSAA
ncbi:MAG: serine/threonine protein kinase [Planctomycetaceae bacterium]|nr:serine/threonine protein kinase [Planctomycetaceae bacterium]